MLKRIKFQTSIDGRGNYSAQTAEQLKEALAAHFGGCLVEITVTGVPKQPENWRRMYYKMQVLPAFVNGLRTLGNEVDPHNLEHLESANDYLARTILGEHEETNAIGQKLKIANDPEKLSDRDYAGFVAKAEAEIFRLFGFQVAHFQREEAKWEQYQRTPMAVHNGQHPVRMDGESWYNGESGPTPGASERDEQGI
jgi:hypothetical protein